MALHARQLLRSEDVAGRVARRGLAVAVGLPGVLAAARLLAGAVGLTTGPLVPSLVVLALCAVVGAVVVLRAAQAISRADDARLDALGELALAHRRARSVTETATDAIVQADASGDITAVNAAAAELFGRDAADLVGRPVRDLMPARLRDAHSDGLASYAAGGASRGIVGSTVEVEAQRADGTTFPVELSLASFDVAGERHFTAILRDVSARHAQRDAAAVDARRLEQALEAQAAIASAGDSEEMMEALAERAAVIVGADGAVVELPDGEELVYRAAVGSARSSLGLRIPIDGSLAGLALRSGAVQHCEDAEEDDRVDRAACRRVGLRSMLCVPLRHEARSVAVLKVLSARPGAFGERDRHALELLAGFGGGALARAQAERRLTAHHVVARALSESDSVEDGLSDALRGLARSLDLQLGAIWLADERGERLHCAAIWHDRFVPAGQWVRRCRALDLQAGEGIAGRAWSLAEAILVDDLVEDDDLTLVAAYAAGARSMVAVPVVADGEVVGALVGGALQRRTYDSEQVELMGSLAAQCAQFAQRATAEQRLAEQADDLQSTIDLAHDLQGIEHPDKVREALVHAVRDATRADVVALVEDAGGPALTAQVGLSLDEDDPSAAELLRVLLTDKPLLVDDIQTGLPFVPAAATLGVRTVLAQPVGRDGERAVVVGWREVRLERAERLVTLMPLLAAETGAALERADLLTALRASARTDQLTGLANRRAWDEELPRELARARRSGQPVAVAVLDLDRFKAFNDEHGHQAGDRLLREASAGWAARLRATDLLARYGGEEFAVVLPGCSLEAAHAVLDALRGGMPDDATVSIGVAGWNGTETPEALVARADAALYRAKDGGRDRVVAAVA